MKYMFTNVYGAADTLRSFGLHPYYHQSGFQGCDAPDSEVDIPDDFDMRLLHGKDIQNLCPVGGY